MKPVAKHTVIVGVGLIGSSRAAAARRAGALGHVTGVGRSRANLQTAERAGILDASTHDLDRALKTADLVVLAAPPDTCLELIETVARVAPASCLVTDVASVKGPICEAAVRSGIEARFLGGHPMAGKTATGSAAADADLFDGCMVVLTPAANTGRRVRDAIGRLWTAVGAKTVEMDADTHDRAVALASHLPQIVASCLAAVAARDGDRERALGLAAGGFRDTTRIAAGDVDMWVAIASANRKHLSTALDRFARVLDEARRAIADGDEASMRALLLEAAELRRGLDP